MFHSTLLHGGSMLQAGGGTLPYGGWTLPYGGWTLQYGGSADEGALIMQPRTLPSMCGPATS